MTHERDTSAACACDAAKVSHRIASLKVVASQRKASHRCIVFLRAAMEVTVFMVHRGDPMGGISSLLLEHASGMNLFQPRCYLETNTIEWRLAKKNMHALAWDRSQAHAHIFDADAWVISLEGKGSDDGRTHLQDLVSYPFI